MNFLNEILNKYSKIVYLISLLFFALTDVHSNAKILVLLMLIIGIFLTPNINKPFSQIKKSSYIGAIVIEFFLFALNFKDLNPLIILGLLLSFYFLCMTIDFFSENYSSYAGNNFSSIKQNTKLTRIESILIAVSALIIITISSTSAPIYKVNYWDDAHCYMTVGRGIKYGLVPYRDLYEQKGPYIYFLHAIASLISDNSFVGVYIIEIIACVIFLVFAWKTVKLFYNPKPYSIVLLPALAFCLYSITGFRYGDSAEELAFPLLTIVVYFAFKAEKNKVLPSKIETLIIGIISGYLFLFKYTFVGVIIGYLLFVVGISFARKNLNKLPILITSYLGGFIIGILPAILYFAFNGALNDLYEVYFYNNIFLYKNTFTSDKMNFVERILYCFSVTMNTNEYIYHGLILSIVFFFSNRKSLLSLHASMLGVMLMVLYFPSTHMYYYSFILSALIPFAAIPLMLGLEKFTELITPKYTMLKIIPAVVVGLVACFVLVNGSNLWLVTQEEEKIPQIKFAQIIDSKEDSTLLTYDVMDDGFYLYANRLPNCRYFCYLNIMFSLPELRETQDKMIEDSEFDFIVTKTNSYEWDNYEIVCSSEDEAYGVYYLYQLVEE